MIYFISDGTAIKIGRSHNVTARLKDLNCGNSNRLSLLASIEGHSKQETAVHVELAEFKLQGEWFRDCAEVRSAIERYRSDGVQIVSPKAPRAYRRRVEREVPDVDLRLMNIDLFRLPMAEARSAYLKNACGAMEAILAEIKLRRMEGQGISDLIARASEIDSQSQTG